MSMPQRFLTDKSYEIYMSKKTGKPKTDYPDFELTFKIKDANVKKNRFTVIYTQECCKLKTAEEAEVRK